MKITVKADFAQVRADIRRYKEETIQKVKDVVNESALNVQADAKRRVPVDTGDLRSSITIEPANLGDISFRVGTKKKHGPYVEYGTGKFSTHPAGGRRGGWWFPASAIKSSKYKFKSFTTREGTVLYFTEGQKPQPFLHPAAEAERPKFYANMRRALQ